MQAYLVTIVCKFGGDPAIRLRKEAIFMPAQKCPYHVTFDLDLDLEHTLDACLPGDHRVQVWWRSGQLSVRRSDLCKSLQTDRRTDDGRRAIALAHSWNELIKIIETPPVFCAQSSIVIQSCEITGSCIYMLCFSIFCNFLPVSEF